MTSLLGRRVRLEKRWMAAGDSITSWKSGGSQHKGLQKYFPCKQREIWLPGKFSWTVDKGWAPGRALAHNKGLSGAHSLAIKGTHLLSMSCHHEVVSLCVFFSRLMMCDKNSQAGPGKNLKWGTHHPACFNNHPSFRYLWLFHPIIQRNQRSKDNNILLEADFVLKKFPESFSINLSYIFLWKHIKIEYKLYLYYMCNI